MSEGIVDRMMRLTALKMKNRPRIVRPMITKRGNDVHAGRLDLGGRLSDGGLGGGGGGGRNGMGRIGGVLLAII